MLLKHLLLLVLLFFTSIAVCQHYPIIENGEVGSISQDGQRIDMLTPATSGITPEKIVHYYKKHSKDIPRSQDPKQLFLSLNKDKTSFTLKNQEGQLLDKYQVDTDTLEMYFFLYEYARSNPGEIAEIGLIKPNFHFEDLIDLKNRGIYDNLPIKMGIKNIEGDVLLPPTKVVKGIKSLRRAYIHTLNQGLFFCENRIFGLSGEVILKADRQTRFNKDFVLVQHDDKYGIIGLDGKVIIPYQERKIKFFSSSKVILSGNGSPDQLVSFNGDTLLEGERIELDRGSYIDGGIVRIKSHSIARVDVSIEDSVYGYINSDAEWILKPKKHTKSEQLLIDVTPYDLVKLEVVNKNNYKTVKQGVVNIKGETLIELSKNTDITILSDHWVKIVDVNHDSLIYFQNVYSGKRQEIIGKGISVKPFTCSNQEFLITYHKSNGNENTYKNVTIFSISDQKLNIIAEDFDLVNLSLSNLQRVIIAKKGEEYFLFNPLNSKNVSPGFDHLTFGKRTTPSENNTLFIAEENGKKGVLNDSGEWLIKPKFQELAPFVGELALAQEDSLSFQYINKKGRTVWKLPEDDITAWNKYHFLQDFNNCRPSIYTQKIGYKIVYEHKILESSDRGQGCVVKSRYFKNPNPEWINKTMTCTYDNSLPFKEAIQPCLPKGNENECNCEGELWDIMSKTKN